MEQLINYRNREFQKVHSKYYFKLIELGFHYTHSIEMLYDIAYALTIKNLNSIEKISI